MALLKWPSWPNYGDEEEEAVLRVIRSGQLFAAGDKSGLFPAGEVSQFENEFSEYLGVKHSLGVGNATEGLHLVLAALGIGIGHEVIVTPYTHISTASSILMQNAVPIFADCERETLALCSKSIEKNITEHTRAISVVSVFGYPANMNEIVRIAEKYDLDLIEDASHAHGGIFEGKRIGTFGRVAVFSLHQAKAISSGDGGVISTNDSELATKIYRLRSFGDAELSYNYRMTEFSAALARVGLTKLDSQNDIRISNAEQLATILSNSGQILVRKPIENSKGVYHSVLMELTDCAKINLDELIEKANARGLPLKRTWAPLHRHAHFNPIEAPARGLPWCNPLYSGLYKDLSGYRTLKLPVIENMCDHRLLELLVNPPVGSIEIDQAGKIILDILGE